jgi:CheY-like chemotaxis protein
VLDRKKSLLCIDDESTGLRVRKLILERSGYHVFTAEAGEAGLIVFDRENIDAVIVDFFMPGMDGGAVAKAMKLRKPKIPIILLSAFYSLPDGATEAVDAFLTKGDSPEILLAKLTDLLGGEQLP